MPEGPEIRIAADKIQRAIRPYPTTEVFFAFDHLKPFEADLSGCRVTEVETRGKAMLTHFDNGLSVYTHNQLYGKWMVRKAHDFPETNRQLRFAIHNEKKSALLYSASDIQILSSQSEIENHPFLSKLGPDVLSKQLKPEVLQALLSAKKHCCRRLSTLYLDQHFLAGIGNYLRSEILFVAQLHPQMRPIDCTDEQLFTLANASISIAYQSYRYKGVTNDLDLANRLKAKGLSYREYRYRVFGRVNQPCYACATPIIKEMVSNRRIYYCPTCQPLVSA
ncbi:Formamidopyrimidine-DNA glycosylase H2TH domain family [Synechococcus sp. PCC 7335]|uniref:endonuclease VIII n=1 Tax=Synechococcus sp. (strain ATCC 29403 / PCC 7335) TaxID=91464 RepID=UPI00017EC035|nr:endonuclease VIII [Synechococcus sp. PCC 7335]EDX87460.1 Formamidopyrimidine-DNA glycosylase H2TH domain family [Synechococcus sp. PCC 7335]